MISEFVAVGTKTAEHCIQHNRPRCVVERCRGREIGANLSGKEIIGAASPSSSKHKTVHSSPAQASPLSGGSRGSRKHVRDLYVVPTASQLVVALESAAGKVTLTESEGKKSPVKRDYFVKTKKLLSLLSGILHVTASISAFVSVSYELGTPSVFKFRGTFRR